MTRKANARIAGFTFLLYIAAGVSDLVIRGRATSGDGVTAKLASIAHHLGDMRISVLLALLQVGSALVLAVTLHALTREVDPDVALMAMIGRVCEGIVGAVTIPATLVLLWLATVTGADAPDATITQALGTFLFRLGNGTPALAATFFAVGSTLFAWLFLRGRMIPAALAWLGVIGSALLVIVLPLQLAGFIHGLLTQLIWIPIALFELVLAPWLLIKGVADTARA